MSGKIHIYCGDGKGKTTASVGLTIRMTGAGGRTLFAAVYEKRTFVGAFGAAQSGACYGGHLQYGHRVL